MTFVVDGTNGLTFNDATTQSSTATNASNISSGTLGKARLPTGSVLQVVNATYSTTVSSSSSTYADTGLTATITPSSATSKILVIVNQTGLFKQTGNTALGLKLLRGATQLAIIEDAGGYTNSTSSIQFAGSGINYLDSPATTSATVYKTQFNSQLNTSNTSVQTAVAATTTTSSITLMEIAA